MILPRAFSWICGQDPAHTWICGGLALPCCQRCAGLYLGALAALVLQVWVRPPATRRFLWIHGIFLMAMVPFGFHWLPQGPLLRGWTGVLFGFGLVTFLRQAFVAETRPWLPAAGRSTRDWIYWTGLVGTLAAVGALDFEAERMSGLLISVLLACGALALWTLAAANVWLSVRWLLHCCRRANAPMEYE